MRRSKLGIPTGFARALSLATSLLLAGCPGRLENPDSFPNDSCALDIFNNTCAKSSSCHLNDSMGPAQGGHLQLNYDAVGDGKQLIGAVAQGAFCAPDAGLQNMAPIIDPQDPKNSLLYNKLEDNPLCGPRMPFLAPKALTADEKQCILDWISGVVGVSPDGG
jgi:hypothetical protein